MSSSIFNWKCPFHVFMAGAATTAAFVMLATIVRKNNDSHGLDNKRKDSEELNVEKNVPKELLDEQKNVYHAELYHGCVVALQAGKNIMKSVNIREKSVDMKGNIDFVTDTDKANEILIVNYLKNRFPHHTFIGEVSKLLSNDKYAHLHTLKPFVDMK